MGPLLGVGLGFALGIALRPAAPTPQVIVREHSVEPSAPATNTIETREPEAVRLSALERLRALLSIPNRRDVDISAAVLLVRELEVAECKAARPLMARLIDEDRDALYEALARRWAGLDPMGAFTEAELSRDDNAWSNRIGFAAGHALVALNPDAALERINSARNNDIRLNAAMWVLPALAKINGPRAAQFLASNPRFNRYEHIYVAVATEFGAASPHEAIAWAKSIEPKRLRERSVAEVFRSWAERDPRAIAAAFDSHPELKSNGSAISTAIHVWSKSDPRGALAFAESLENKEMRDNAIQSIYLDAAKIAADPELLKYIGSTESLRNAAVSFAGEFAREDVHKALAWIDSLSPGETRTQALKKIMDRWSADDPIAAANHLATQPASKDRESQMANVVGTWSREDPEAATAFAQRLPAGRERDLALSHIIENLSESDAPKALALAQTVTDPEAIGRLSANLLSALGKSDPEAALQFIARVPASAQADAYHNFVRAWAPGHGPQAAEWLNTLPEGAGRDAAIKGYVSVIDGEDPALATRWAASIQNPTERLEALFEAFERWTEHDIGAAENWLGQSELPEGLRPFFEKELANEREKRGQ